MIPYCILVIEDDDDRAFMEQLFVDYHRLMYHEIFKLVHDQWAAEDVMQSTLVRLIDKIPELRIKDRDHLVNYIITASKNQARNYMRDSGRHSTSDLQEFMEYEDPNMDGEAIELQVIKKEDLEALSRIWTQLDERTRYLLEGYYILNLPAAEMARELNIKPASLRMALTRARKTAYQLLQDKSERLSMAAAPFAFWCRETHSIKFLKNSLQFLIKFVLINKDELQFDLNLQEMFI